MKYGVKDFNDDLKDKIKKIESEIYELVNKLLEEHKPKFAKKDLHFEAEFDRAGDNPFIPGYSSSITTAIFDGKKNIWSCIIYQIGNVIAIS